MPNGNPKPSPADAAPAVQRRPEIDTTVAHPARRYNYLLGGKDHFAADRESANALEAVFPTIRTTAVENRAFLRRTVGHLTERGIRQFVDVGTGIPAPHNTHEVAQALAPQTRVVYVDNDPLVLVHARALLTSHPHGRTACLDADLRDPEAILASPEVRNTLDLDQPVGLLLVAILHFLLDADDPHTIVESLVGGLAPGSYLVLSHGTTDHMPPEQRDAVTAHTRTTPQAQLRTRAEITRFFDGLHLVEPGLVSVADWRPQRPDRPTPAQVACYGGVAHKPPTSG